MGPQGRQPRVVPVTEECSAWLRTQVSQCASLLFSLQVPSTCAQDPSLLQQQLEASLEASVTSAWDTLHAGHAVPYSPKGRPLAVVGAPRGSLCTAHITVALSSTQAAAEIRQHIHSRSGGLEVTTDQGAALAMLHTASGLATQLVRIDTGAYSLPPRAAARLLAAHTAQLDSTQVFWVGNLDTRTMAVKQRWNASDERQFNLPVPACARVQPRPGSMLALIAAGSAEILARPLDWGAVDEGRLVMELVRAPNRLQQATPAPPESRAPLPPTGRPLRHTAVAYAPLRDETAPVPLPQTAHLTPAVQPRASVASQPAPTVGGHPHGAPHPPAGPLCRPAPDRVPPADTPSPPQQEQHAQRTADAPSAPAAQPTDPAGPVPADPTGPRLPQQSQPEPATLARSTAPALQPAALPALAAAATAVPAPPQSPQPAAPAAPAVHPQPPTVRPAPAAPDAQPQPWRAEAPAPQPQPGPAALARPTAPALLPAALPALAAAATAVQAPPQSPQPAAPAAPAVHPQPPTIRPAPAAPDAQPQPWRAEAPVPQPPQTTALARPTAPALQPAALPALAAAGTGEPPHTLPAATHPLPAQLPAPLALPQGPAPAAQQRAVADPSPMDTDPARAAAPAATQQPEATPLPVGAWVWGRTHAAGRDTHGIVVEHVQDYSEVTHRLITMPRVVFGTRTCGAHTWIDLNETTAALVRPTTKPLFAARAQIATMIHRLMHRSSGSRDAAEARACGLQRTLLSTSEDLWQRLDLDQYPPWQLPGPGRGHRGGRVSPWGVVPPPPARRQKRLPPSQGSSEASYGWRDSEDEADGRSEHNLGDNFDDAMAAAGWDSRAQAAVIAAYRQYRPRGVLPPAAKKRRAARRTYVTARSPAAAGAQQDVDMQPVLPDPLPLPAPAVGVLHVEPQQVHMQLPAPDVEMQPVQQPRTAGQRRNQPAALPGTSKRRRTAGPPPPGVGVPPSASGVVVQPGAPQPPRRRRAGPQQPESQPCSNAPHAEQQPQHPRASNGRRPRRDFTQQPGGGDTCNAPHPASPQPVSGGPAPPSPPLSASRGGRPRRDPRRASAPPPQPPSAPPLPSPPPLPPPPPLPHPPPHHPAATAQAGRGASR